MVLGKQQLVSKSSSFRSSTSWTSGLAALFIISVAVLAILPYFTTTYYKTVIVLFVINTILVMSYRMITTMGGWSFSHIAITGLGAYTMAILTQESIGWTVWQTLPVAVFIAGGFAALISFPVLRTHGFYFFLSTFAAGEALRQSFQQFPQLTGGLSGIAFIPQPTPILGVSFETVENYYLLCLAIAVLSGILFVLLDRSRIGRTIRAVASNEELSLSIGISARFYRALAFVIGSMVAAVGGVLFASFNGLINPVDFGINFMFKILSAAIIGGVTTIWGPILGLLYITIIEEVLRDSEKYIPLFYGISVIAILIFAENGLEGVVISLVRRLRRSNGAKQALKDDASNA